MHSKLDIRAGTPVGIYIHIPFCKAKCDYCAFVSTTDMSMQRSYVQSLIKEISVYSDSGVIVDTVYVGGGTPSCLYIGALSGIFKTLRNSFAVLPDAEITVEMNPESCRSAFIDECADCGVNRISIGLQSSCDSVLRSVGRVHSRADFINAVTMLSRKFDNISSDLILGLPLQTENDITESVNIITDHCVHASVYALSVEDGTKLKKRRYCPDDDIVADFYDRACDLLFKHGFSRYEVSNFAKEGFESRHNIKYWKCLPYIGFGAAAHGYDGNSLRYGNTDDINEYICGKDAEYKVLNEKDKYNEYVMLRLRTENGIDLIDFRNRFGYSFYEKNEKILNQLSKVDCIKINERSISICPDKMFVMNGIIEELLI